MTQASIETTQAGPTEPSDSLVLGLWVQRPEDAFALWMKSHSFGTSRQVHFDSRSTKQYLAMFGVFARWLSDQHRTIGSVSVEDLDQFANNHLSHVSDTTRWRYLRLIARVYEHLQSLAGDDKHPPIQSNPAKHLMSYMRAPARAAPVFLDEQQCQRYIEWVCAQPVATWMDSRDRALRAIFLASGITLEEARGLTLADVHTVRSQGNPAQLLIRDLHIAQHQLTHAHAAPVAAWAQQPILHWFTLRSAMGMATPVLFVAREREFHLQSPAQEPMSATEIFVCIQAAMVAIGHHGERQGAQTLRNTFIARQLNAGVDAQRIARWTGLRAGSGDSDTITAIARQLPYANGVHAV